MTLASLILLLTGFFLGIGVAYQLGRKKGSGE